MSLVVYSVLVSIAVLAALLGAATGYFYFRARHREHLNRLEVLALDLAERERALHGAPLSPHGTAQALSPSGPPQTASPSGPAHSPSQTGEPQGRGSTPAQPGGAGDEVKKLREELEQKNIEFRILRQDFEVETGVLAEEIESLKKQLSDTGRDARRVERMTAEIERQRAELREEITRHEAKQADLERDRAALVAEQERLGESWEAIRQREARIDDKVFSMPASNFSGRQEELLIKRLRHEIKLQREELERLHSLHRRAADIG